MSDFTPWTFTAPSKPLEEAVNDTRPPELPGFDEMPDLTEIFRETHRRNHLSQMSLVARYMALDPITRDAFEERSAILEESCGLSRAQAERQAFQMVMRALHEAAA